MANGKRSESEYDYISNVENRLLELESRFSSLMLLRPPGQHFSPLSTENGKISIHAHFARSSLDRMPFKVTFSCPTPVARHLTPIRTAILISLLLDLMERSEGNEKAHNYIDLVREVLGAISSIEEAKTNDEAIRMALYRANQFIEDEVSDSLEESISLRIEKGRIYLHCEGIPVPVRLIEIQMSSSDPAISAFLDRSLATSPLSRIRKSRGAFVPGGEDGQDRLLLELLDHGFPVKQTCMFFRPTVQSLPKGFSNRFKFNPSRNKRQSVALTGYQSGRLRYTEILQRQSLLAWASGSNGTCQEAFLDIAEQIELIDHLLFLIRGVPGYELVLTDCMLPFYITTFEIVRSNEVEHIVLFFQNGNAETINEASTFGFSDESVYQNTHNHVIRSVLSHPTTARNKDAVCIELERIKSRLLKDR